MSGEGKPTFKQEAKNLKIAIVAGSWHEKISEALIAGSVRAIKKAGATYKIYRVSGAFELGLMSERLLSTNNYDAVVALGVIIQGGTVHFDYIAKSVTDALTRVALDTKKPVGFGVLTIDNEQQGIDRAGLPESKEDKGAEAAEAAMNLALSIKEINA